jgi:hypothetical protein
MLLAFNFKVLFLWWWGALIFFQLQSVISRAETSINIFINDLDKILYLLALVLDVLDAY